MELENPKYSEYLSVVNTLERYGHTFYDFSRISESVCNIGPFYKIVVQYQYWNKVAQTYLTGYLTIEYNQITDKYNVIGPNMTGQYDYLKDVMFKVTNYLTTSKEDWVEYYKK